MLYHIKELTVDEIKLIGAALGKLPHEIVHVLLAKIQNQINEHEAAQKSAEPAAPATPAAPASGTPAAS